MPRRAVAILTLLLGVAAEPLLAGTVEVRLRLPVRARLDLAGRQSITVAPFLVVSREGEQRGRGGQVINVQEEFERYLLKILRRETELEVVESGPIEYPTYDASLLARDKSFWQAVGEKAQADLIVAGSLDFDIQDRSGYRTEEYVSPFDGRTYYRQVLIEQTGFEYDILMQVYDGQSGDLLHSDNFKDFKNFESENADPLRGMFENLFALENQIVGLFTQKDVEATRLLFLP